MSKMSTERARIALNGPTMGTRWTALFYAEAGCDTDAIRAALQAAVNEVDSQMSTWKPDSALMRINAAPVGDWVVVPEQLCAVLGLGLEIGRASGGAFDIGMGDAVTAWGFGPGAAAPEADDVAPEVARIKSQTDLPIIVGFGIRTPEMSEGIARIADGAVVGSAIVSEIAAGKPVAEVLDFVRALAEGAHRA